MIHKNTVLSLRFRYLTGLSVIALLVTTSFFTMQRVVSEQRNFSGLVNLAGHQAGLANRISYFASLMAVAENESEFNMAKSQVGLTVHKMRSAYHTLRKGDPAAGIPMVSNDNLLTIYEDPMFDLDLALTNFLEQADRIHKSGMNDLSLKSTPYVFLTTYGPHVLEPLLDAVVDEYETIGKNAILKIERFEQIIWVAALVTLMLELVFIFAPLDRHIRKTLNSLESSIKNLTKTRKRLLSAQQLAVVGDWELQLADSSLTWSDQVYAICGVSREDFAVTPDSSLQLVHPEDRDRVKSALIALVRNKKPSNLEYRIIRPDLKERLVFQYAAYRKEKCDGTELLTGTIQDISERKELSTRLEKLSEHIPGFIFQYREDTDNRPCMPYVSRGIILTCGIEPEQLHDSIQAMTELLHPEDVEQVKNSIEESKKKLITWHAQFRICHPDKGYIWLEGHATPERLSDGGTRWYGYIWDITERKHSEDRIRKLALYDPLTGLANRRLLKDRLSHALATSSRSLNFGAVIMLDLDNFKSLNDTKGHEVGDALLVEVADRLNSCVRESDTISRLGGDEFVVVLECLAAQKRTAQSKAMEVAEKIRVTLSRAYFLGDGGHVHHASASIGVTLFQGNAKNESELLKRSDVAMYEAKDLGRNCVCLYSEERQAAVNQKSTLAHGMQSALENEEFTLYLQPQISGSGRLRGAEALLRWLPPGKDPISPGVFIPIAESTGLILPIGEWVLARACRHVIALEELGLPDEFALAVNISARQFNDNAFVGKMKAIIERSGVNTRRLKFELTETCLVQDLERGKAILSELRELGLTIELDDFGTGYSSLNSLNKLPIHTLKIDCSLIHGIENENSTKAIVRATLAMARAMSLEVIAEGVETPGQRKFLIDEGCDILQGYLYARPMPYDAFAEYLVKHSDTSRVLSFHCLEMVQFCA